MKQFSYLCAWVLILGCQGVTPSIAGEPHSGSTLLLSQKGIQAQSPQSEGVGPTRFRNVEGTLKEIQGNVYIIEGGTSQQPIRVEVGRDTAFPNGEKEPGQLLHALISTSDGHALIIR